MSYRRFPTNLAIVILVMAVYFGAAKLGLALAFDRHGHRLGQGGGYYDRTLEAQRAQHRKPIAIGLAFAGQEVSEVPVDGHDQKLDAILTEKGYRPLA